MSLVARPRRGEGVNTYAGVRDHVVQRPVQQLVLLLPVEDQPESVREEGDHAPGGDAEGEPSCEQNPSRSDLKASDKQASPVGQPECHQDGHDGLVTAEPQAGLPQAVRRSTRRHKPNRKEDFVYEDVDSY